MDLPISTQICHFRQQKRAETLRLRRVMQAGRHKARQRSEKDQRFVPLKVLHWLI